MKLDSFIWSVVFFSLFIVIINGAIVTNMDTYGVDYNSQFNNTYDLSEDLYDTAEQQKNNIVGNASSLDEDDPEASGIKGALNSFKLLTAPISLVSTVLQDISKEQLILNEFYSFFIIGLTVSVVFGIAYLIFRIREW